MKSYDDRQADFAKREQDKESEEHKTSVKLAEVRGKVTGDIRSTNDVRVKIDNVDLPKFHPSVDLKKGDFIKITIEKVAEEAKGRW